MYTPSLCQEVPGSPFCGWGTLRALGVPMTLPCPCSGPGVSLFVCACECGSVAAGVCVCGGGLSVEQIPLPASLTLPLVMTTGPYPDSKPLFPAQETYPRYPGQKSLVLLQDSAFCRWGSLSLWRNLL